MYLNAKQSSPDCFCLKVGSNVIHFGCFTNCCGHSRWLTYLLLSHLVPCLGRRGAAPMDAARVDSSLGGCVLVPGFLQRSFRSILQSNFFFFFFFFSSPFLGLVCPSLLLSSPSSSSPALFPEGLFERGHLILSCAHTISASSSLLWSDRSSR